MYTSRLILLRGRTDMKSIDPSQTDPYISSPDLGVVYVILTCKKSRTVFEFTALVLIYI